jgi:hypothetical protein
MGKKFSGHTCTDLSIGIITTFAYITFICIIFVELAIFNSAFYMGKKLNGYTCTGCSVEIIAI